ncbi:hypothetical protein HAX54_020975, partial [Datura stramonium]|nr:hypothetical protein [Datura stramonium]
DPTTRRIWFGIATAHDLESHDDITEERLYQNIFASHLGQLAIIFLWTFDNLFHVAWQGNFESWVYDPLHVRPIAHAIWDPHFRQTAMKAFTRGGSLGPVNITYSGVYQWWCTIGQWNLYAQNPNSSSHLFGAAQGAGTSILTLLGGFHPQMQSLWLTDISDDHLAIAFIFLIASHMYRTNFGIGHNMKDLLGLVLASLGVITPLVAQHMYSLCAYAFIAQEFTTQDALYTHHQYIVGFIMTGAFVHGAIFFIRDYNPEKNEDNILARMLDYKEAIISHLSWDNLFL